MSPTVIQVHRLWTEYRPDPADPAKMLERDMVAYGPIGAGDRNVTIARIAHISKVVADDGTQNPVVAMARFRWDQIRPHYEAYKAGRELVVEGTPLGAWNAISPEQAEVLRMRGVQTIEQLSALTSADVTRIGLPGLAGLITTSKLFLESSDRTRTTAAMDDLKSENEILREQLAELTALVNAKLSEPAETASTKRK